jgi:RNA polymerase-binding transcription factor DksA
MAPKHTTAKNNKSHGKGPAKVAPKSAGARSPSKPVAKAKPAGKASAPMAPVESASKAAPVKAPKWSEKQQRAFREMLLSLRERITSQIEALKGDSLERHDSTNIEEDGTDAFERQFALNLVSSEQDALFEIDEAIRRLEEGTYGLCVECSGRVEDGRLKALPFVKTCIKCQSALESVNGRIPRMAAEEKPVTFPEEPVAETE